MKTVLFAPRLALLLVLGLALAACDAGTPDPGPPPVAPALPSATAFAFDDSFPSASGTQARAGMHHNNAAFRVGLVSLVIGVNLLVPGAATNAAGQASPVVQNGTWIWENTVTVEGRPVTCRLEGTPDGTEVDWRMLISSPDLNGEAYDDFPLYTATTALNGQSGTWQLNYRIEGQTTHVLDADYEQTSGTVHAITFSIPPTHPNENARGASVLYEASGAARLFDWHEATPGQTHLVEWDAVTRAGSITAWNYNGGQRACWDGNLDDAPCSEPLP